MVTSCLLSFGSYLVTIWLLFGHYLVTIWSLFGRYLVSIWSLFGHSLVTLWLLFGRYLVASWSLFGHFFDQFCYVFANFDQLVIFNTLLVTVWSLFVLKLHKINWNRIKTDCRVSWVGSSDWFVISSRWVRIPYPAQTFQLKFYLLLETW